jgi:hypothetical protein
MKGGRGYVDSWNPTSSEPNVLETTRLFQTNMFRTIIPTYICLGLGEVWQVQGGEAALWSRGKGARDIRFLNARHGTAVGRQIL